MGKASTELSDDERDYLERHCNKDSLAVQIISGSEIITDALNVITTNH